MGGPVAGNGTKIATGGKWANPAPGRIAEFPCFPSHPPASRRPGARLFPGLPQVPGAHITRRRNCELQEPDFRSRKLGSGRWNDAGRKVRSGGKPEQGGRRTSRSSPEVSPIAKPAPDGSALLEARGGGGLDRIPSDPPAPAGKSRRRFHVPFRSRRISESPYHGYPHEEEWGI